MPKFDVTITKTVVENTTIEVTAANEDLASEAAEKIVALANETGDLDKKKFGKVEWDNDSLEFEVSTVDEQ